MGGWFRNGQYFLHPYVCKSTCCVIEVTFLLNCFCDVGVRGVKRGDYVVHPFDLGIEQPRNGIKRG